MSLPTLSYFSKITFGGLYLNYVNTSEFTQNGYTYSGVITLTTATAGDDFIIDQTPTYHRIKVDQNKYLAPVQNTVNIPQEVKNIIGNYAGTFFSTVRAETRFYITNNNLTPVQSTINLRTTNTNIYAAVAGSSSFLSVYAGNILTTTQNTGAAFSTAAPSQNNIFGGEGTGVNVDANGNQILEAPSGAADFTASASGPILGAIGSGVLMPGFSRSNAFLSTTPMTSNIAKGEMRYMPYTSIANPDITQYSMNSRGLFDKTPSLFVNDPSPLFGYAVTVSDLSAVFAVSSPVLTSGFIKIYELSSTPVLLQTITPDVGSKIGESLLFNTDASVLVFNTSDLTSSTLKIYIKSGNTWIPSVVNNYLTTIMFDPSIGGSKQQLGLSKDGRTIVVCSTTTKLLLIIEDTSIAGDWSSFYGNDMSAFVSGTQINAVCISPEGSVVYSTSDGNLFDCYRRQSATSWINTNATLVGPYGGGNANIIKTCYNGTYLIIGDSVLGQKLGLISHLTNNTLIYVGEVSGDIATTPIDICCNISMSLIISCGASSTLSQTGKTGAIIQNTVNQLMTGIGNISSVAFFDNNIGSILLVGSTADKKVHIVFTSLNPRSITIGADNLNVKSFNTNSNILSITTDGTDSSVNPGTPNTTDLGGNSERWRDIYFSGKLLLPGNTGDSAFASSSPDIALTLTASTGSSPIPVYVGSNSLKWSRSNNNVSVVGLMQWSSVNNAACAPGALLQISLGSALPGTGFLGSPSGMLVIKNAALILPTNYQLFVEYINPTTLGINTLNSSGNTIPFTCGLADPAPSLNPTPSGNAYLYFSFSYQILLT
jgi:hypothetical protein